MKDELVLYKRPTFYPACDLYYVEINGKPVDVFPVQVSAMAYNEMWFGDQRPASHSEQAGLVHFDFSGSAHFRVVTRYEIFSVKMLPESKHISLQRMDGNNGDELCFTITKPGQYVLEVNGAHFPLHIFADPMETDKPDCNAPNVQYISTQEKKSHLIYTEMTNSVTLPEGKDILYYGPGEHYVGVIELKSNQSVYVDGGAVVYAAIRANKQQNLRIYGRGILNGRLFERTSLMGELSNILHFDECDNITVEGITIQDSMIYNFATAICNNMLVKNMKIFSWRKNSDGIDMHNNSHVRVEDCFVRCFDDCICLKGQNEYQGYPLDNKPLHDVTVERCTIWADWGRPMEIGAETSGSDMSGVLFHDCDILHFVFAACDVQCCGNAPVHDIVFDDIRIGEPLAPQTEPRLLEVFLRPMCWMPDEGLGYVRDITFRNLAYTGSVIVPCRFIGYQSGNDISGIHLENITLRGRLMTEPDEVLAPIIKNDFADHIYLNGKEID